MLWQSGSLGINKHLFYIFIGVVSGALMALATPGYNYPYLTLIGLIPVLICGLSLNAFNEQLTLALSFGLVLQLSNLAWVTHVTFIGYLFFALYISLYSIAFVLELKYLQPKSVAVKILGIPALWVSLEWLKSHLFTGVPWHNLSTAFWQQPHLLQLASIVGPEGLSFFIVFFNVLVLGVIYPEILDVKKKDTVRILCFLFLMSYIALYVWGIQRLKTWHHSESLSDRLAIGVVQPNISHNDKWDKSLKKQNLNEYIRLSRKLVKHAQLDLLVWPESCIPEDYQYYPYAKRLIRTFIKKHHVPILFGSTDNLHNKMEIFFNSAFLLDSNAKIQTQYNKNHLVAFGEYVPFKKWFPFIQRLSGGGEDFTAGSALGIFNLYEQIMGVVICVEDSFTYLMRQLALQNIVIVFNLTNDSWFESSRAAYHHTASSILSAISCGFSIVRACNTGISGYIHGTGEMEVLRNEHGQSFMVPITGTFHVSNFAQKTLFAKYGDWFSILCIVLTLWIFTFKKRANKS